MQCAPCFLGFLNQVIVEESTGVWNISLISIPFHKAKKVNVKTIFVENSQYVESKRLSLRHL
jgi:hypothetical protein